MSDAEKWNAFLLAFHDRFPAHVGKRRRRQMFALAQKILAEEVSADEAEKLVNRAIVQGALSAVDKAIVLFLVFIAVWAWTMLLEPNLEQDRVENPEARQRFYSALFSKLEQALENETDEEQWPFPDSLFAQAEPAVPLGRNPPQSPKRSQTETSASPKSGRRKPASRSKAKKPKKPKKKRA